MPESPSSPRNLSGITNNPRERYQFAVRAIARELVDSLNRSGTAGEDAWDFLYNNVVDYDGGSGCPATFPFGCAEVLQYSCNVNDALQDAWECLDDQEDNAITHQQIFYIVRYDVFEEVKKLRPDLQ